MQGYQCIGTFSFVEHSQICCIKYVLLHVVIEIHFNMNMFIKSKRIVIGILVIGFDKLWALNRLNIQNTVVMITSGATT